MKEMLRILTLLNGLKTNIPNGLEIEEYYVLEYHKLLNQLTEALGENLDNFRVPQEAIIREKIYDQPDWETGKGGGYTYGPASYCEKSKLMSKLDALISYISFVLSSAESNNGNKESKFGFHASDEDS